MSTGATRLGRADLHVHTMASDGTATVSQVLARAEEQHAHGLQIAEDALRKLDGERVFWGEMTPSTNI